jgi:hypothetical protein
VGTPFIVGIVLVMPVVTVAAMPVVDTVATVVESTCSHHL